MDRARRRPRHRALAVALAMLLVPLVVGSVAAKPPGSRPAVTAIAGPPTGTSLFVTADINRVTGDIASCTYVIDGGAAVPCGVDAVTTAKKVSTYTIALSDQAVGLHTITVTVVLNDGGSGSGSDTFTISPPSILVIAWTDIGERNYVYDEATDSLISKLVDTNRDSVVSVGDTVVTGRFPLNLAATTFADARVTSFVVTGVIFADHDLIRVDSGAAQFLWQSPSFLDRYAEVEIGGGLTQLYDQQGNCLSDDSVTVSTFSPSWPTAGASERACGEDDAAFIDVTFS